MNAESLVRCLLDAEGDYTPDGYRLLASTKAGDYELKLWAGQGHIKGAVSKFAELSLNRAGLSFDPASQGQKFAGSTGALGHRRDLLVTVAQWLSEYGPIFVGSHSPQKLAFYHRILRRYLPRLSISEPYPAFDESEGVADYFRIEPPDGPAMAKLRESYSFPDYGEQEKPEHWEGGEPEPSPYPLGITATFPDTSGERMEIRFEKGGYRFTKFWRDVWHNNEMKALPGGFRHVTSDVDAKNFIAGETKRYLDAGCAVEPLKESVDDPLDGIEPGNYVDGLPSLLDRMKAESAAIFDQRAAKYSITSANCNEWAESIAVEVVDKYYQVAQSKLLGDTDIAVVAYVELIKYLTQYADERNQHQP